jgi:5'-deoxynucleotidase YfbR-like HD superfamily hydrolase
MNKLRPLYQSGAVSRFHTMRTLHRQTVAEHAWGVAVILLWLYAPDVPPPELLRYALLHDAAELETGDIPATAKWASRTLTKELRNLEDEFFERHAMASHQDCLSEDDIRVVQFCDSVELLIYALTEADLGNAAMISVAERVIAHLENKLPPHFPRVNDLYVSLCWQTHQLKKGRYAKSE